MEKGELAHSTIAPFRQEMASIPDDAAALDAAATKLLTASTISPSIIAAVEHHRAARTALNEACIAADTVAIALAGGDTSPEAMAPLIARREAAVAADNRAMDALLSCRPMDAIGLAQMLAYIAESPAAEELEDSWDTLRNIAAAAQNVADSSHGEFIDPIFALIEKGRRLLATSNAAFAIHVPDGTNTPPEVEEAVNTALHNLVDHCRGVLLQTVPQTAAGCQELARFAVEYFEHQDVPIDDNQQAVTSLIARSPFMAGGKAPRTSSFVPPKIKRNKSVRLDLCDEALALSIDVSAVRRLSSIARHVCGSVLQQEDPLAPKKGFRTFRLNDEQVGNLHFIIDHVADAADAADKSFEALEEVLTQHTVTLLGVECAE